MIAVDTNFLIHAHRGESPRHWAAHDALTELVGSRRRIGLPWPCVHEFLAVLTHPRVFRPPSTAVDTLSAIQALAEQSSVTLLAETTDHLEILARLLQHSGARGAKIHDARIAAICLGHGVDELWTADRDFSYFPMLRTRNPLVG